jgi:hypothetical protein
MRATKLAFERQYGDGSGVEYGVYYDENNAWRPLTIKSVHEADFDIDQLDWLIEALTAIRKELDK